MKNLDYENLTLINQKARKKTELVPSGFPYPTSPKSANNPNDFNGSINASL